MDTNILINESDNAIIQNNSKKNNRNNKKIIVSDKFNGQYSKNNSINTVYNNSVDNNINRKMINDKGEINKENTKSEMNKENIKSEINKENTKIEMNKEKGNDEKYNIKKISKKNNNKRSYKKHIIANENNNILDKQCFIINEDIKIYDGTTIRLKEEYEKKINYLKTVLDNNLLTNELKTSTLTVKGKMSNILFDEKILIKTLSIPTGYINKVKSKFGVLVNPEYKEKEIEKPSNRGRKPDKKKEKKFFNTQITFEISIEPNNIFIIKLFRNGVFQVSGIKFKDMNDLIPIANILKEYLIINIKKDIKIIEFKAVMRNYKCKLLDNNILISLKKLENILKQEKNNAEYNDILNTLLKDNIQKNTYEKINEYMRGYNLMNIAEITYISGKSLNIKMYRPKPEHIEKKITIKIYIKGKINFDGFNSQIEAEETYYWINHILKKYSDEILINTNTIKNEQDDDTDKESIYDDNIDINEHTYEYKVIPKIPLDRKKLFLSDLNDNANTILELFR
jgi:hypothetical protein